MDMTPIKSSTILAAGFEPGVGMDVQFRGKDGPGGTYRYAECPRASFDALVGAESAGKFFASHIRPHFKALRLENDK